MDKLNKETIKELKKIQLDIEELLFSESNIEVVWKLKEMHYTLYLINIAQKIESSI